MALSRIVDRIKGMFSGGTSASSSRANVVSDAAGPGHPGADGGKPDLREKASDLAEKAKTEASDLAHKAKAEASSLADQAKHATSDLQQKAEEAIHSGQQKSSSAASDVPSSDAIRGTAQDAVDSGTERASGMQSDLTDRVDELKTSADAQIEDATNEFEERRS